MTEPETNRVNGAGSAVALNRTNVFAGRCVIRPLRSPERLRELIAVAQQDDHAVIAPTHIGVKNDQIVGYMSLGGAPMLQVWLASKLVHAGEAVRLLETAEAMLADKHTGLVVVPCSAESPFTPHMERLGYHKLGATVLWAKQI